MTQPVAWQAPEPEPGPTVGTSFASPGSRLIAYILDILVQFVIVAILAILSIVFAAIFFPLAIITSLAIIVVSVGYFPYFWARTGQTPGMSAMKIKVVRDADGGPLTTGPGDPAAHRPVDRPRRLLHRGHLDLRRQAQARLAGPDRRHGRHRAAGDRLHLLTRSARPARRACTSLVS